MQNASGKIEVVQAMRGVAALLVVLWHATRYFGPYGEGWAAEVFHPGSVMGVALFFLISGFIMVVTTGRSPKTPHGAADFLLRRFARIWPPYAAATLVFLLVTPGRLDSLAQGDQLGLLLYSLAFLPHPGANVGAPVFDFPFLPVGWSLNYEMYFYVIFAASLAFGRARWVVLAGIVLATLFGLPFLLGPQADGLPALITSPLVLMFIAGCCIGLIYQSRAAIEDPFTRRLAMFVAFGFVVYQYSTSFRLGYGLTDSGLSLAPLLLVFSVASKTEPLPIPRPLVYLGDISYSLYIFHPMLQGSYDFCVQRFGLPGAAGVPAFLVTTAASLAGAAISHRYLERRLSDWLRRRLLKPSKPKLQALVGGHP